MMTDLLRRLFAFRLPFVFCLIIGTAFLLAAAGCSAPVTPTPAVSGSATPSRVPRPTVVATAQGASTAESVTTLIWWTPEFLSPQAAQPAGAILAQQLEAFTESQDGQVRVEAIAKARYGKGGLLDFLRTAQPVASDILPDIIALDVVELESAVTSGALQPLNPLLDGGVIEGLYAFASEAGQFGQDLYAVQYLVDIDQAVYLPEQVTQPPTLWSDVLAERTTYLFPLAVPQATTGARPAENLSHAVLSHYLSAGATYGSDRMLTLEAQPLLRLLTFYQDARTEGLLPPNAQELADGEAVWSVFSQGQVPLAYASARRFWTDGAALTAGFAAEPGLTGPATPIVGGWALAIVTTDPQRQRAAADLIAWLLRPENAGAWAKAAGWLPTSAGALEQIESGPYWEFLDERLAVARALPIGAGYATVAASIQAAVLAVVQGESDAATAVDIAVNQRE